jgi:hypothetical protein
MVLARSRELREPAGAPSEDLITRSQLGYVLADGLDRGGHIRPRNRVLWPSQSRREAHEQGHAGHQHPIPDMDRRRVDAQQDLVVPDPRPVHLAKLE